MARCKHKWKREPKTGKLICTKCGKVSQSLESIGRKGAGALKSAYQRRKERKRAENIYTKKFENKLGVTHLQSEVAKIQRRIKDLKGQAKLLARQELAREKGVA